MDDNGTTRQRATLDDQEMGWWLVACFLHLPASANINPEMA